MPLEAQTEQIADQNYRTSWYTVTPNRLMATLGALGGEINCDVCVIGAGFTGISAAYEFSQKGYSVILLEAKNLLDSATGKNGSHLLRGYQISPDNMAKKYTPAGARMLCNLTLEGLALIVERIARHDIKCDLKFGHVTAALYREDVSSLTDRIKAWGQLGHTDLQYISAKDIPAYIDSKKYVGGLYDPKGAHFHPLNYALGVLQTAQAAGCKIYDETPVHEITQGATVRVRTQTGAVNAKFVVLSGHIRIPGIPKLSKKIIPAAMPMLATQPLGTKIAGKILPKGTGVTDTCSIMNYFNLSHDGRLLFGSVCPNIDLQKRMTALFPDLKGIAIAHRWDNPMDFTLNRMPHFGRLADNIFYAHGYCGQGVILGNLAGKLMAEAVSGTAERFDVFAGIRHLSIPGGDSFKKRMLAFGMAWHRLQDSLL
ncbi:MAG: FAD-binding oxidoreductase [Alphaproteobacteria bacterium]|nr:FAD-binding oxidoreductase [Alphaproteobacteria bacterium]